MEGALRLRECLEYRGNMSPIGSLAAILPLSSTVYACKPSLRSSVDGRLAPDPASVQHSGYLRQTDFSNSWLAFGDFDRVTVSRFGLAPMQAVATKEEAAELRALVRAGRLFDVQAWLEAGKPFRTNRFLLVPLFVPFEPCVAAVETGFFNMVECFLRCKLLKPELNEMLCVAVQKQRPDLVELLFNKGANVDAVRFEDVLLAWNPDVISIFLDRGADYKTDSPFAEAFAERRRTALGFFKTLVEREPELISQANQALAEHVRKNDTKWVSLMLWLGADPHAAATPSFDNDPTTAVKEAARSGRLELLKRFKVDPKQDDLLELVEAAIARVWSPEPSIYRSKAETLEYILGFGPDLNQPTSSGELIMDIHFQSLDGHCGLGIGGFSLDVILCLAKHGAQWDGGIGGTLWFRLPDLRLCLRKLHPRNQIEVLRALSGASALTPIALKDLVSTHAMRALLKAYPIEAKAIREYAGIRSRRSRKKASDRVRHASRWVFHVRQ